MAEAEPDETSLVGISLTGETGCCHTKESQDTLLGFILVDVAGISVDGIRAAMMRQLDTLPSNYRFLTSQGWPVTSTQESLIKVKHLINDEGVVKIQPDYAKPRIGVVTDSDDALGFVFVSSLNLPISQLREAIIAQLGGSQSVLCSEDTTEWMFLDRNRWPICRQQEEALTVIDLVVRASVRIQLCPKFKKSIDSPDMHPKVSVIQEMMYETTRNMSLATPPAKKHRAPEDENELLSIMGHSPGPLMSNDTGYSGNYLSHSMRSLSPTPPHPHRTAVDVSNNPNSPRLQNAKQILISYVRAEASQYALDLKVELEGLNFSVYLDVHEIFCGSDWQDSLNFAVSHCSVFVPLVTPRYGETQWTNREVKLADVLNKFIVPVSFLESWPPRCLAIQFATTQYISWKRPAPGMKHEKGSDVTEEVTYTYKWERPDVAMVGKEIGKRCNEEAKRREQDDADGNNKGPQLRSYASTLPPGVGDLSIVTESRKGKPLVVISVHPKQRAFVTGLVDMFESQGYEVWCSIDVLDDTAQTFQMNSNQEDSDTLMIEDAEMSETDVDALSPEPVKQFVAKAEEAGVVIFVLSKAFASSITCKEQVFYCETRKRVVPLVYEDFEMPGWMTMLIGTSTMEHKQRENYKESMVARVKRSLNPNFSDIVSEVAKEAQISKYVEHVCNKLPEAKCVYISGGTKFFYDKSEQICRAIGTSLARHEEVSVVTGGFYGVGEIISKSFLAERRRRQLKDNVWHILPAKDQQDRSAQARQNSDKTFKEVPYGNTLFCGEDVRQRETIVSRVFDICILVEGGPGAAHEAEEFAWSDHTVIPIKCTGGAAGGKFKVPDKIFEVPPGVSRDDWNILADSNIAATKIGDAVARIIKAIQTGASAQITRMKSVTNKRASLASQHSFVDNSF